MAGWLQKVDAWMRRRIRMVFLKRWKLPKTKYRNLRRLGESRDEAAKIAGSSKGYWYNAKSPAMHRALNNRRLQLNGFPSLYEYYQSVKS